MFCFVFNYESIIQCEGKAVWCERCWTAWHKYEWKFIQFYSSGGIMNAANWARPQTRLCSAVWPAFMLVIILICGRAIIATRPLRVVSPTAHSGMSWMVSNTAVQTPTAIVKSRLLADWYQKNQWNADDSKIIKEKKKLRKCLFIEGKHWGLASFSSSFEHNEAWHQLNDHFKISKRLWCRAIEKLTSQQWRSCFFSHSGPIRPYISATSAIIRPVLTK